MGPWQKATRKHSLQNDSISCGVFTAVFAEAILKGTKGYLACSSVQQERERLGWDIFRSLDKSGICHINVHRKSKEKCSTCLVNIHKKCLPGNQEDVKCLFCQDSSEECNQNKETEGRDSSGHSQEDQTGGFLVESVLKRFKAF
ncbi:hypothetical protein DPEC_G00176840 [Dallia pectoralis]|uniref:Uncharacterized protein n=1 Tax=Dallia pectoralis TaxID=75939 RepID=A0ACC2GF61_DALPE|nr:hypothetical protein DPEC_G00176840 [Dallia pectoralis]